MPAPPEPSDPVEALDMVKAGLLAVSLLLAGTASYAGAEGPESETAAVTPPRLSYLDGPVSFWRPGVEDWTPAEANMAIAPGDELHTGYRGNVELQVGARAFVRAWGDTQLGVTNHAPELLRLRVSDGHVAVDARALDPGLVIQLDAPSASFAIDRPGYYRLDVTPDRTSLITRRDGHATMTRVEAGATQSSAAPAPDVWDRWNEARTEALLQAASARYVPEGVYGVRDLDDHGGWRVVPTYGAVWVPRGIPAGWAPYTTGRWVWDPRFGWTWIDTAAWGWAPYHHGRWVHLDGLWAWAPGPIVPRPVYAPALVAFFSAPGVRVSIGAPFVSWVALGWGEPLVPWWGRPGFVGRPVWHGWGGPRIVNNVVIQRTTVVHVDDIRVYRNAGVHRAVVAVHRDRFGRTRVQDARVTAVDTARLRPVRGPLREVAEPARGGEPRRPALRPPAARLDATPRRVEPRPQPARPEPRPRVDALRPETTPRAQSRRPEPRAESPRPRAEVPRRWTTPPAAPARPDPRPRMEAPRPQMPTRPVPSRPEVRSGETRPPRPAANRIAPERRPHLEQRRGPAASPALKGPAAPDRPGRGNGRERAR